MADAEQQSPESLLTAQNLSALAVLRIYECPPVDIWEAIGDDTRRLWLNVAMQESEYATHAWGQLPQTVQRRLRQYMRFLAAFLASIGLALHKSAAL